MFDDRCTAFFEGLLNPDDMVSASGFKLELYVGGSKLLT